MTARKRAAFVCAIATVASMLAGQPAQAEAGIDYYLTPDIPAGTAPAGATEVQKVPNLKAGDTLYLSGTYKRNILVMDKEGVPGNPIRIIGDNATIDSTGNGLILMDTSYIEVGGIHATGRATNTGIMVWHDDAPGMRDIRIDNVSVEGFRNGLFAGTDSTTPTIDGLSITNSTFSKAVNNNVLTHSPIGSRGLRNVTIDNVTVHSAGGDPTLKDRNSGSGIVLGGVTDGVIRNSLAYNNGLNSSASEGPEGIWAYSSDNLTIENNVSRDNKTSGTDGNGFGFDIDVHNSVMRGNVSRNNYGAGYLVYTYGDWHTNGNIVENNRSENDNARSTHSWSPIVIAGDAGKPGKGYVSNTIVRNNTIVQRPGEKRCAVYVQGRVRNVKLDGNKRTGGTCELTNKADNPGEVAQGGDVKPFPTPIPWGSLGSGSLGF